MCEIRPSRSPDPRNVERKGHGADEDLARPEQDSADEREGTFADLRPGVTVEVKHEDPTRASADGTAEWIKIQIVAPS